MSRLDRITSDPELCHGKPVIRGLRYPVADILQLLAGGMSVDEVLAEYPDLERDDVLAALEYGALAVANRRTGPDQKNTQRRRAELNRCTGFCRPLPEPLGHAAGTR